MAEENRTADRGQLSLSVVEAGVGVVLILAVAMGFALGVSPPDDRAAQLDLYAEDAATVLAGEPPRHGGATRLSEVVRSSEAFERERAALRRRVARILPDNLMFRLRTPHGAVGFRKPAGVAVGSASVTTQFGDVTIWVWYA
ncbi:hypothetical protein M0R89_10115 [Halorussus limi]|uniref:Uncharacterized protein n=1 Tax=Halorussus limi TaxID=2938695 RepID=A0A8U0HQ83_9EURY|nr:hypothetical protein [Halorussus limi]UPV72903.1 hypothetical protein M0R89_10115 [Halorussus limi]